ncbi:unnamed protein product [Schistosoma rodhaini]|uniref:Uncharacterized protein n=1 Tax=Schistosoma rodhaini TaxID=6188 RepID=A0AA85FVR4_9TREM|nr:unnamed protein product [Schistosoma rodhaini]CAH8566740.1 unnamed protein product [Schistosoma rodhaini]
MMNKHSLTTITPLLCITIHIENYIELQINDEYNLPILQYRYEQYFKNPWKQPKKLIKTKLILTYTSLILKDASWWPFRLENSINYNKIQKCFIINQKNLKFAIGLYDENYIEKQFIIIKTKNIYDLEKLIQFIDTQLLIWKYTINKQINYSSNQRDNTTNNKQLISFDKTLNRKNLMNKKYTTHNKNDNNIMNSLENNSSILDIDYNTNNNSNNNNPRYYSQQCAQDDNDYKSILQIYPNVHNNDFYHDKRIIETIPSTSNHFKSNNEYQKRRIRKEKEGFRKLKNKHCQTDLIYIDENNIKSWEVDIKHVRYDPIQGNILDDNGSVYLYSAHEID